MPVAKATWWPRPRDLDQSICQVLSAVAFAPGKPSGSAERNEVSQGSKLESFALENLEGSTTKEKHMFFNKRWLCVVVATLALLLATATAGATPNWDNGTGAINNLTFNIATTASSNRLTATASQEYTNLTNWEITSATKAWVTQRTWVTRMTDPTWKDSITEKTNTTWQTAWKTKTTAATETVQTGTGVTTDAEVMMVWNYGGTLATWHTHGVNNTTRQWTSDVTRGNRTTSSG